MVSLFWHKPTFSATPIGIQGDCCPDHGYEHANGNVPCQELKGNGMLFVYSAVEVL